MRITSRTKIAGIIIVSVFAFLIALVVGACTWVRKNAVETYNTNIVKAPFDAIIVPGIPFDTVLTGNGAIIFKSRILWSKRLYQSGITKNIIYSGAAVHTPYHEGEVMKMIAEALGIPAENIFVEGDALHSNENVIYGLRLALKLGFSNVAVATDPYQSLFLKRFVMKNKMKVALLPLSVDSMPIYRDIELPKVDSRKVFVENFIPLKDRKQ